MPKIIFFIIVFFCVFFRLACNLLKRIKKNIWHVLTSAYKRKKRMKLKKLFRTTDSACNQTYELAVYGCMCIWYITLLCAYRLPRECLPTFITHNETHRVFFFFYFVWLLHSHVNQSPCNVWVNPFKKQKRSCAGGSTIHKSDKKKINSVLCIVKSADFFISFFLCNGTRHAAPPLRRVKKKTDPYAARACGLNCVYFQRVLRQLKMYRMRLNVCFLFLFNSVIW